MSRQTEYKKALVTGGAGFIGSHIADLLLEAGIEVVILDDLSVGRRENTPEGAKLMVGDICDDRLVSEALKGVDVVFHQAARVSIRDSFRGMVADTRANVLGTVTLLQAMAGTDVRKFVMASSMAVYGEAVRLPICETDPVAPQSPYGIGKMSSEHYISCFCSAEGIDFTILRYFNTFGSRQTPSPYVGVITIFAQKLLKGEPLPIFGDGEQVRDFISVHDVARANLLAMDYKGTCHTFNIGSGKGTSVNTIALLLIEALGMKDSKVVHLPPVPGEPSNSVADIRLAERELGFVPQWSLQQKLPEVLGWNRHLADDGPQRGHL